MFKESIYSNDFPNSFFYPSMDFENQDDIYPQSIYDAIIYAYVPPEKEEENADMTESPDTKMVVNEEEKEIREEEEINEEKEIKKEIDLFPFEKGEGLFNKLKNDGINFTKHYNKKYNVDEIYFNNNDNEKKSKKKLRTDNIKKKIKRRFHTDLKNVVNKELEKCGINKNKFITFQEMFIDKDSYVFNCEYLNYTYEELIKTDFTLNLKKIKKQKFKSNVIGNDKNNKKKGINQVLEKFHNDQEKYKINNEVLNYLNDNPKISENSKFDKIKKMEYIDLLKAYFLSKEYEDSIIELCKKCENKSYNQKYINQAQKYVNQFLSKKIKLNENIDYDEYSQKSKIISINSSEEDNEFK